jgi:regulator of cell morphogenesis and NO signaling
MTTIDLNAPLGDIVIAHPELARELERRGLDYCCHGRTHFGDACRAAGLDPETVAADLEVVTDADAREPWATLEPGELVDHIERVHHQYLWAELPRLSALLDKVVAVHGARHPELDGVSRTFTALREDLEPHLVKEERVLFPMIRELAHAATRPEFHCGRITNPIAVMMLEHDRAGELLAELRRLTNDYDVPADGCNSFRALYEGFAQLDADTHLHIHKENNLLFPAVVRLEDALAGATNAGSANRVPT